jgi:hypothetical protein
VVRLHAGDRRHSMSGMGTVQQTADVCVLIVSVGRQLRAISFHRWQSVKARAHDT